MPNVTSAKKRVKTNKRRMLINRANRTAFRSALKKANLAIASGDGEAAKAALPQALRLIGITRQKGMIHPNKAARQESRLMKKANALAAK